jgi:hypothetical protein
MGRSKGQKWHTTSFFLTTHNLTSLPMVLRILQISWMFIVFMVDDAWICTPIRRSTGSELKPIISRYLWLRGAPLEDNIEWCVFHLAHKQKNLNTSRCCIGIWVVLCMGAAVFGGEAGFRHHGKYGLVAVL